MDQGWERKDKNPTSVEEVMIDEIPSLFVFYHNKSNLYMNMQKSMFMYV